MVEAAAFVAGWFTPTSLFVLLNIVIATIFFTSAAFGNGTHRHQSKKSDEDHQPDNTAAQGQHPQLFRAPSLFSRVTSFNFTQYSSYHNDPDQTVHQEPDPAPLARAPSFLSRVSSFTIHRVQTQPDPAQTVTVPEEPAAAAHESREEKKVEEKKEEERETNEATKKVVVKQKKGGGKKAKAPVVPVAFRGTHHDEEVDAKADDFINKFKQQLKMQRLESLLRYRSPATATAS